jgi:hypothetical protein
MLARAIGSAAAAIVLTGCVSHSGAPPPGPPRGSIDARPGRAGAVVAAPHGTSDPGTGDIAAEVARRTGFGFVVASGFALDGDTPGSPGRRFQVNRPSEGVPGQPPGQEVVTPGAREVYRAYEAKVREAARGPLALYAEIHGNGRAESAERIEIATVGVDEALARRLRTLFELVRDAHLRAYPGAPRLAVLVEPADRIVYTASGAKREGILRLPERALHVELPRTARRAWRDAYTAILADFLTQAFELRSLR